MDHALFWATPNPELPEVILLHGVMAGHLAHHGILKHRVWLTPATTLVGNIAERLRLADDGVTDAHPDLRLKPDGNFWIAYNRVARTLRKAGVVVHEFSYDWRKGVGRAAERLNLYIEMLLADQPHKKVVLVGHSMGGLVAATYAARFERWRQRVERAVFVGTSLGGSFSVVEAVTGSWLILQILGELTHNDDMQQLRVTAASFPGMLDMLPCPELFPQADKVYEQHRWANEQHGVAPQQKWLDQSLGLKQELQNSPLLGQTTALVSGDHPTVCSITEDEHQLISAGPFLRRGGDGVVPLKSSANPKYAQCLAVHSRHESMIRDDQVINAVRDLVVTGKCALDPMVEGDHGMELPLEFGVGDPPAPMVDGVGPDQPVDEEPPLVGQEALDRVQQRLQNGLARPTDLLFLLDPYRAVE